MTLTAIFKTIDYSAPDSVPNPDGTGVSKAFDSVTHNIVSNKLKALRISLYIHSWIISILSGRPLQHVIFDGMETDYLLINKGVPQTFSQ